MLVSFLNILTTNIKICPLLQNLRLIINKLTFLGILFTRGVGSLDTDVFRKETYTRLDLNFYSLDPLLLKIISIKTLLHGAYNICSDWHNFLRN